LFLAVVIDLFSREVVGWSMRPDMHRSRVIDALEMGLFQRRPPKGQMIFHSDRGSQYASDDFRDVLERHGVSASMSRKGNCWDNAVTETLFGSLKVERLHGERFQTIRQAKDAVLAWLLWYNRHPCKSKSRESTRSPGALRRARNWSSQDFRSRTCASRLVVPASTQDRTSICCLRLRRAVAED